MPVGSVHLVQLATTIPEFLARLSSVTEEQPMIVSRVIRWIIRPTERHVSPLLDFQWDLLVVFPTYHQKLPEYLSSPSLVRNLYTVKVGIPSSLVKDFASKNQKLLHPAPEDVPGFTGSLDRPKMATSSQNLEMTPGLNEWISAWEANGAASGKGAVSMLNLLAFKPGMHEEYLKYGKAFAESIGSKRGGKAKLVGRTVNDAEHKTPWDEFALAHYPSARHFADMAASEDYQAVNHKHRIGSLADTCILMTSELDVPGVASSKPKL